MGVIFISEIVTRTVMAKTDSFCIRGKIAYNGSTYAETTIDLGSFVDALGKEQYAAGTGPIEAGVYDATSLLTGAAFLMMFSWANV